jgi:hypothetical protein
MKGFIITSLLTLILMVCIFINWSYVNSVSNAMLELIESISDSPSDENDEIISKIQDYWESQILPMKLSINYREIDEISNIIDTIQMANESNDSSKLAINIELLKNAIEKIIQLEKISIRNIAKNDSRKRVILVFLYSVSIKK